MRFLSFAIGFALAGAAAGCGAAYWAATQWTSFSNHWLYAAGFVPCLGAILGGWMGSEKGSWPPALPKKVALSGVSSVCGGLSGYVAFALVSSRWNHVAGDASQFVSLLFSPSKIPDLFQSSGSGNSSTSTGAILQLVIGLLVGALMPALWFRGTAPKK